MRFYVHSFCCRGEERNLKTSPRLQLTGCRVVKHIEEITPLDASTGSAHSGSTLAFVE